jgi:tRNA(Ile)-lysidine synthase
MSSPHSDSQPDLVEAFLALEPTEGRPRRGEGIVVALSGGADSVVLLHLLTRLRERLDLRLLAAHADHGLREESAQDLTFCRSLCARLGVPFAETRLELGATGTGGLEAEARRARYRFLDALRDDHGLDVVATGHHQDDHVETLLLWLFRGSGLRGLRGIAARSCGRLRPLQGFSRAQLRLYAEAEGLEWQEDATNLQPVYLRNRIRHELRPLLVELFGEAGPQRLGEFARRATEELDCLQTVAAQLAAELTLESDAGSVSLEREAFVALPFGLRLHILRRLLERIQPETADQRWNETAFRRVLSFVGDGQPGRQMPLPGGGTLHLSRHDWALEAPTSNRRDRSFTLFADSLPTTEGLVNLPEGEYALFDADRVHFPLILRTVEPGDRIQPAGMAGHKRLAELLREQGVPRRRRSSALVVEDADEIIWAVGRARAAHAEPGESSQRILRLQVVERAERKAPE